MIQVKTQFTSLVSMTEETIATFVFEDDSLLARQIGFLRNTFKSVAHPIDKSGFSGKFQDTLILYPEEMETKRIMVIGLGKQESLTIERIRRAAATAAKSARSQKSASLAILEPELSVKIKSLGTSSDIGSALTEGALLSLYKFDKYQTTPNDNKVKFKHISVIASEQSHLKELSAGVRLGRITSEATYLARDLENAPSNEIYPESLANKAKQSARQSKFKIKVLGREQIQKLGMGGLIGVSQGSVKHPRFLVMEYDGSPRSNKSSGNKKRTLVIVGKGVTFDSGGISIKPSAGMAEMKMDMSGAASVIGTMQAAAQLRLPIRLIGLVPAAENLPSGTAIKPGDILTHLNGKTSEVDNTDAEGRLILADALSYAVRYKPDLVIDLATLTGAVVVALGHHATGMMGNDDDSMNQLKSAGDRTYERVWQLPMFEEYEKLVKSDIADVKNVGGRWAGAITAAMFLAKFVADYKWIHLDIAGTAMMEESSDYIPKGGSGVGVRLLVDFIENWK